MKKLNTLVENYKDFLELKKTENYHLNYKEFIIQFIIAFGIITTIYVIVGYTADILLKINYLMYYFTFSSVASFIFAHSRQENKFKVKHNLSIKHIDDTFVYAFDLLFFYLIYNFFLILMVYKPYVSDLEAFVQIGLLLILVIIVIVTFILFRRKSNMSAYEVVLNTRLKSANLSVKAIVFALMHLFLILILPIDRLPVLMVLISSLSVILLGVATYIKTKVVRTETRLLLGISLLVLTFIVNLFTGIVEVGSINPFKYIGSEPIIVEEFVLDDEEVHAILYEGDQFYVLTSTRLYIYDDTLELISAIDVVEDSVLYNTSLGVRILSYTPEVDVEIETYRPDHLYSLFMIDDNYDLQLDQNVIYPFGNEVFYTNREVADNGNRYFEYIGDQLIHVYTKYSSVTLDFYNTDGTFERQYRDEASFDDEVNDDFALFIRNEFIEYYGANENYSRDMKYLPSPLMLYSNEMVMHNYIGAYVLPITSYTSTGIAHSVHLENLSDISETSETIAVGIERFSVQSFSYDDDSFYVAVRQPENKFDFISYDLDGSFNEYISIKADSYSIDGDFLFIANDIAEGINITKINLNNMSVELPKQYISNKTLEKIQQEPLHNTEEYMVGNSSIMVVYIELLLLIGLILVPLKES